MLLASGPDEFRALNAYRALRITEGDAPWSDEADDGEPDADADIIPLEAREGLIARIDVLHRDQDLLGIGFAEAIEWLPASRRWEVVWPEVELIEEHLNLSIPKGGLAYAAVAETLLQRLVEHRLGCAESAVAAAIGAKSRSAVAADASVRV